MEIGIIIQSIIYGIMLGGIYTLISTGLNLIFGVLKIINFAHGEFLMLGMYITYWLYEMYKIDPYVSIVMVSPILFILGIITMKILIEPIRDAPEINQILTTVGLMIVLQNVALLAWKADFRGIGVPVIKIEVMGVPLSGHRLVALIVATVISTIFYVVLMRTDIGRKIRAVAQDADLAEVVGIDVKRVGAISFGIGTLLVGVASAIIMPIYYVFPMVGVTFGLMAWIVIVLGGLGSFTGALVGSFIIGLAQSMFGLLVNIELAKAFAFLLFIIVLILKPEGLLGKRARV